MQIVITEETWQWMFGTIKYFVKAKKQTKRNKQQNKQKQTKPKQEQKNKTEKIQNQKRGKIT